LESIASEKEILVLAELSIHPLKRKTSIKISMLILLMFRIF